MRRAKQLPTTSVTAPDLLPTSGTVTIKHGDQTYTASYTVARGMITVSGAFGDCTTQLSGSTAENFAKLLLAEMVDQGKGK